MYQVNPRAYFWGLVKSIALAANASGSTTIQNASDGDLYVRTLRVKAWLTNAATAIAGSPLNSSGFPTAAGVTLAATTLVKINLKIGNRQVWQEEVSLFGLHGEAGRPYEFDLVLPKVANRQEISWSVTNNTAVAVTVELSADCLAVPAGEQPFQS